MISVPSFEPALSVARPSPSRPKLPRNSADGAWPTGIDVGADVVEEPVTQPGKSWTLLAWLLATDRSAGRRPELSDCHRRRPALGLDPRAGDQRPVRRRCPGPAGPRRRWTRRWPLPGPGCLAVEIGHGNADRVGPGEEAMATVERRAELAVAEPRIDQHVVAAAVGDDQVGDAVAVEVSQLTAPGASRP